MELKGKKINFLGDSITEGCGTSGVHARFTTLIAEKYGAECRNYGIGGTRIARQLNPTEAIYDHGHYLSRVPGMDPDADAIVVFGGTNDFGHGDAPLGQMSDRCDDTFYGALHLLFIALLEKYPDAKIAILTSMHRLNEDNPRGDGNKPQDVGILKDYVEIVREVAEYYSLPVLDLFKMSGVQPKVDIMRQKFMPDGLHPNDAGHVILADQIATFLESL